MNKNASCPALPESWPVGAWPAFNRDFGLFLFLLHTFVFVASLTYMLVHRKHGAYRQHNVGLTALSACSLQALSVTFSFKEYYGRDNFDCDFNLWFQYLPIAGWLGPIAVQLLQLKNRLEWQEKLSGMPVHLPAGISIAEFVTAKYKAGHRRAYLSMAFFLSIYSTFVIGYAFSSPRYFNGCSGCKQSQVEFIGFSVTLLFCLSVIWFALIRIPKPAAGQPPQYLVRQLRVQYKYFLPGYIVYLILAVLDPSDMYSTGNFGWNNFASMLTMSLLFYTTAYPGLRKHKQRHYEPNLRLLDVIQDPVLLPLFENHLKSEFLLENLRFYFEATMLKRNFPAGELNTRTQHSEWHEQAMDLYDTFIKHDALLQLNLPSFQRRKIEKRLGIVIGGTPRRPTLTKSITLFHSVQTDLYDESIDEVLRLMEKDTFLRFVRNNKIEIGEKGMTMVSSYGSTSQHKTTEFSSSNLTMNDEAKSNFAGWLAV